MLRGGALLGWPKSLWLRSVRISPKGSPQAPRPTSSRVHRLRVPIFPSPLACHPQSQPEPGLPRAPFCMCHASAGLTLTLSPACRVPRASWPACDEPAFPCSLRGGWSPVMTGTSCVSTLPSTPRRRSSWPCRRLSPTRSAPSSWCLTCWPRRTPGAQSTRAVSTGSGGHSPFPRPRLT